MSDLQSSPRSRIFNGQGSVQRICQAMDWPATKLGELESWSEGLYTAFQSVLACPAPSIILWGPEMFQLYNNEYQQIYGHQHLPELGKPFDPSQEDIWQSDPGTYQKVSNGETVALSRLLPSNGPDFGTTRYDVTFTPIIDGYGGVAAILITAQKDFGQVTDKINSEKFRQFSAIVSQAMSGFARGNADGTLTFVNERFCQMLGYARHEVLGSKMHEFTHPDDRSRNIDLFVHLARTGEPFDIQKRYIRKDGSVIWVHNTVSAIRDIHGRIEQLLAVSTDITDRKQAEEALRLSEQSYKDLALRLEGLVTERTQQLQASVAALKRSNDNLEQFAYVASHDLQEPLRKVMQFGGRLRDSYQNPAMDGPFYLERMLSAAERMSILINDLLNFSRLGTGMRHSQKVLMDSVVEEVLNVLELDIKDKKAKFILGKLPAVDGDGVQLTQLFQNLVSNALKFSKVGLAPVIKIQASLINKDQLPAWAEHSKNCSVYHQIQVIDNGIGFNEEYVDRIFKMFQRLNGKSEYTGTGIGLAICEKVAVNHGGAIGAASRPGYGATFSVILPG